MWRASLCATLLVAGWLGASQATPAGGANPLGCSSPPSSAYAGACATYNGDSTWFGSYVVGTPGSPTPLGWGFCAEPAASGSDYPDSAYDYVPTSTLPSSIDTANLASTGFALSQAAASGFWNGQLNTFTKDQAATAGKLFYDYEEWGGAVPAMDAGVAAAFQQLVTWQQAAVGATSAPQLSMALSAPSGSPPTIGLTATLAFPGTSSPVPDVFVLVTLTNATFADHTTTGVLETDAQGAVATTIVPTGLGTVGAALSANVGQPGMEFFKPTSIDTGAQVVAAGASATTTSTSATVDVATNLYVEKFNASEPGQGVPNATYQLFVQGTPPASTPPTPPGVVAPPGTTYFSTGTTDATGHLAFSIPAGYAWCIKETAAPPEFVVDPAVHCTAVITTSSSDPVRTIAVAEQVAPVQLTAYKFNSAHPGIVIPNATYALWVVGAFPSGFTPPIPPSDLVPPAGMELFAIGTTDVNGVLTFTVPSGHAWCLQELAAPPGYVRDDGLHCTGIVTQSSPKLATTIALGELAATGLAIPWGLWCFLLFPGLALVLVARRRLAP